MDSPDSAYPKLRLYYRNYCLYCMRVHRAIKRLGVAVELRNIWQDTQALHELESATGGSTVPVLRIEQSSGEVQWMPESTDIVAYLFSTKEQG